MNKSIITTIIAITALVTFTSADAATIFTVLPNPGTPAAIFNWETAGDFSADGAPGQGNGVSAVGATVSGGTYNTPASDTDTRDILASITEAGATGLTDKTTDWVLSVKAETTGNSGFTRVFAAGWGDGTTTGDLMQLDLRASPNTYRVLAGPGGYSEVIQFTPAATGSITWQVRYHADNQLLDLYADSELVLEGFQAANNPPGQFGFRTARLVSNGTDTFEIDHFLVSNNFIVAPEPGTLSLMAIGVGILALHRRKMRV